MTRIQKTHRDVYFVVIPVHAGIQTGPRIGVRGDCVVPQIGQKFWQLL